MKPAAEHTQDSEQYKKKQRFFKSLLTIYGRKPVLEALQNPQLRFFKLHLADSNKPQGIIAEIIAIAEQRGIEIQYHDKKALSRISKNAKQDQGVAADIQLKQYISVEEFISNKPQGNCSLIALDRITNPQNLGMIIRSVCAGYIDGLILPQKGCAALSPLVIKASTGTVFKTPLIYSDSIEQALELLSNTGATICTLSSHASTSLFDYQAKGTTVYVLGNETEGVSPAVQALSQHQLCIPMNNEVESLNVAITAALIAFKH
ncbi:RNA methyltransferase [Dasania sp. GY-MA-18]|uniref:RNA methyltransferase n=1 Tax=Dasania phycosphaerae TaxID=2950436 RepID=A0A9J6RHM6_9GAMM|nr:MULTISPECIES: RNA methyltransferase [Dasania]MCR8921746.1 RNA methyltransferase [Dasania sp. GY-MA-18]MCZ0864174.1 RNA methyltransferase [Dasania phycosphaerae]MCZ0867902.1 RNA methyltransferase [Dasania phycosphaerae]